MFFCWFINEFFFKLRNGKFYEVAGFEKRILSFANHRSWKQTGAFELVEYTTNHLNGLFSGTPQLDCTKEMERRVELVKRGKVGTCALVDYHGPTDWFQWFQVSGLFIVIIYSVAAVRQRIDYGYQQGCTVRLAGGGGFLCTISPPPPLQKYFSYRGGPAHSQTPRISPAIIPFLLTSALASYVFLLLFIKIHFFK